MAFTAPVYYHNHTQMVNGFCGPWFGGGRESIGRKIIKDHPLRCGQQQHGFIAPQQLRISHYKDAVREQEEE